MPHCDSSILHAPGVCKYCDMHPEWQSYRAAARISYTGEAASADRAPCPSEYFRPGEVRDRWGGNVAVGHDLGDTGADQEMYAAASRAMPPGSFSPAGDEPGWITRAWAWLRWKIHA